MAKRRFASHTRAESLTVLAVLAILGGSLLIAAERGAPPSAERDVAGRVLTDRAPSPSAETSLRMDPRPTSVITVDPGWTIGPVRPSPTAGTVALTSCVGAAAIVRGFDACPQDPAGRMVPSPAAAARDTSDAYADGCFIHPPYVARTICRYGRGKIRIALVGNSHAGQWLPAIQVLAKRHGWTITTFLISRCNATDAPLDLAPTAKAACLGYGRWVMRQTAGDAFDLVITIERQSLPTEGDTWKETAATAFAGYSTYLARWSAAGTNVLVLNDTVFPKRTIDSIPRCLAAHRSDQSTCSGTPETWGWMDPLYGAASQLGLPGISTLDVHPFFCTDTICPGVIGGVVVYFDGSHVTATYARSIAPFLDAAVNAALDRTPDGTSPPDRTPMASPYPMS